VSSRRAYSSAAAESIRAVSSGPGVSSARQARAEGAREPVQDGRAALADALAQELGRHQHESPRARVPLDRVEVAAQAVEHQLERIALGQIGELGRLDLRERLRHLALDERRQQTRKVAEVLVDDRSRDPRPARHRLDRDAVEALLGDDLAGHLLAGRGARLFGSLIAGAGELVPGLHLALEISVGLVLVVAVLAVGIGRSRGAESDAAGANRDAAPAG
jgi:hypothetical protein